MSDPLTEFVSMRLTKSLKEQLDEMAALEGRTLGNMMRWLIATEYSQRQKAKQGDLECEAIPE